MKFKFQNIEDENDIWPTEDNDEANLEDHFDEKYKIRYSRLRSQFSSLPVEQPEDQWSLVTLNISTSGHQTICVSQKKQDGIDFFKDCIVIVLKYYHDSGHIDYIKGKTGKNQKDTYITCGNLQKGTYLVFVEIRTRTLQQEMFQIENEFAVSCYGAGQTKIFIDETHNFKYDQIIS